MTSEAVRKSMQGNKRRDTNPELVARRILRELGYPGYRLDWRKAPGSPDIAYPGKKLAIFIHGCFWHQHEGCPKASVPKSNHEYWEAKFKRNRERDAQALAALEEQGWTALVIWECELDKKNVEATRERLKQTVEYAFVQFETEQAEKAERAKQAKELAAKNQQEQDA